MEPIIGANISGDFYRYDDGSGENLSWFRMTPQEKELAAIVVSELQAGRIPGPTRLNVLLGRGPDNNLHGNHSKIRRAVFLGAGLRKDESRDRWYDPTGAAVAQTGR